MSSREEAWDHPRNLPFKSYTHSFIHSIPLVCLRFIIFITFKLTEPHHHFPKFQKIASNNLFVAIQILFVVSNKRKDQLDF